MADNPPTLTPTHLPEILARYAQGESLNQLAVEAKTNRSTIYRWMLSGIGDKDFGELVTSCLINRIAESDEKLESATDSCNVARAREMARFSRMDLERRRPHLYGPKTEVKQDTQITVIVHREMQAEAQAPASLDQLQAPTDQKPSDILDLTPHVG